MKKTLKPEARYWAVLFVLTALVASGALANFLVFGNTSTKNIIAIFAGFGLSIVCALLGRHAQGESPYIFTHPHAVVTYRIEHGYQDEIEKQITAILNTKPDADLTKHQAALGIKILDIQRTADPAPAATSRTEPPKPSATAKTDSTAERDPSADMRAFDYERHCYVVGGTGQGKSTLISHLALTLFHQGKGCCVIDAKGDLVKTLIHAMPAHRVQDVIYLDLRNPVPINVFADETDDDPEALIGEIKHLTTRGETIEHAPLMQAVLDDLIHTLMDFNSRVQPNQRATFLDMQFFLENEPRRRYILNRMANQRLKKKWEDAFPNQRTVASIVARLTPITNSPSLSKVFGCPNPKLSIQDVMDNKKILLVDLGGVSEPKQILGTLLVAKIRQAAFRRASVEANRRVPFFLFVDEFQYFQTSDFAHILSVARGYHLHLIMANQFMSQLSKEIRASILGNVGNYFIFCLGHGDAQYFAHLFPRPRPPMSLTDRIADRQKKFMETGNNLYIAEAELLKLRGRLGMTEKEAPPPTPDILYALPPYQAFYHNSKGENILATIPPPASSYDTYAESIRKRTVEQYACGTSPECSNGGDEEPYDISPGAEPKIPPNPGKKKRS